MGSGRVDWRIMKKTGKARARFYDVYPESREIINLALEAARKERGTYHDTVALEAICMNYIACCIPDPLYTNSNKGNYISLKCPAGEINCNKEEQDE